MKSLRIAVAFNHKILQDCWRGGGVLLPWMGVCVLMLGGGVCFLNKQLGREHLAFPSSTKLAFYREMTVRLIEHNFSFINWCWLFPITFLSLHLETASGTVFLPLLPNNSNEADQTVVSQILLLEFKMWPSAFFQSSGTLPDHHELSKMIMSGLTLPQHSGIHPTWSHELVYVQFVQRFSNSILLYWEQVFFAPKFPVGLRDLGFLKASLKTKAKKALSTLAFSMSCTTRSSPHLTAGPQFRYSSFCC